jgi:hypothetical protein
MSLFDMLKSVSKKSTRQLIGAASVEDCCLTTFSGEKLSMLIITPFNLSILAPEDVKAKEKRLNSILISLGSADYICIDAAQSYESNKRFLSSLAEQELNDTLLELDRMDQDYLDEIRVKMATNRVFLALQRFTAKDTMEYVADTLTKTLQLMKDNEFPARVSYKDNIKQLLAVYFAQSIYQDIFDEYDGETSIKRMEMIS